MSNAVKLGAFIERIGIGKEFSELLTKKRPKWGSRRAACIKGQLMRKYGKSERTIERSHKEYKDSLRVIHLLKATGAGVDNDDLCRGIK